MARATTGSVIEHKSKVDGKVYRRLRFTAYGKRRLVSLGPVSASKAEAELRGILADVERGKWEAPETVEAPAEPVTVPTFHQYADQWWARAQLQLAAKTRTDYTWRLEVHLLPYFGEMRLDAITIDGVDAYVASKLAEGERIRAAADAGKPMREDFTDSLGRKRSRPLQPLSPRSINMTVTLLAAVLESALERDLIGRNPAKGKKRRVPQRKPSRSYLESAAQIEALLDAAGEMDKEATQERAHLERRAILATMVFAGLRISELCSLRWRDVDLAGGWLKVGEAKTDAGTRKIKMQGALRDELLAARSRRTIGQDDYVFPTRTGKRQYESKVRTATLGGAVKRANANLAKLGLPPLPEHLTPHSLRRTFASVRYALGATPPVVMAEMGHTSPSLALAVYTQAMARDEAERVRLQALVDGAEMAFGGIPGANAVSSVSDRRAA